MKQWVDEKCKQEGRPWSSLPTFTEDEIELIKGLHTFCSIVYIM